MVSSGPMFLFNKTLWPKAHGYALAVTKSTLQSPGPRSIPCVTRFETWKQNNKNLVCTFWIYFGFAQILLFSGVGETFTWLWLDSDGRGKSERVHIRCVKLLGPYIRGQFELDFSSNWVYIYIYTYICNYIYIYL